jgi:hypothetical protein
MAVIVTAAVTARCWKQHTCCACGCVYRYLLERTRSASGGPGSGAATQATYSATNAILKGIEERPCPSCGVVQPDMAGKSKAFWHLTFTAITGGILLLITLPTLGGRLPFDKAGEAAAAVAGFALLGHLVTALCNPNWSLKGNQKESRARMEAGEMLVDRNGGPLNPAAIPTNINAVHLLCLLAILVSPLGFLAARFVSDRYPMPRNAGLQPDVVGPGDTVKIPVETKLRTHGGYWYATASVKVLNADELGVTAPFHAGTQSERWGKIIAVNDSRNPLEPIKPWAKVAIPNDPELGGKTVKLQINLTVTYPMAAGARGLQDVSSKISTEAEVQLTGAGADRLYKQAWYVGGGAGMACSILGGLVLALMGQVLKSYAIPPQTYML